MTTTTQKNFTQNSTIILGEKMEEKEKKEEEEIEKVVSLVADLAKIIPTVVKDVIDILYNKETAKRAAESFVTFYKTLVENGIEDKLALEMAREYFENNLSIKNIIEGLKDIKIEKKIERKVHEE